MAINFQMTGLNSGVQASEEVTVGGTAIGITAALLDPTDHATNGRPQYAWITNTHATEALNFRIDGTNPTTTVGHRLAAGDSIILYGITTLRAFRAIQTSAGSALFR
jgi:hypothetical protein